MAIRFDSSEGVAIKIPIRVTRKGEGMEWGQQSVYEDNSSVELSSKEDISEVAICLYHPDLDPPYIHFSCEIRKLAEALRMLENLGEK